MEHTRFRRVHGASALQNVDSGRAWIDAIYAPVGAAVLYFECYEGFLRCQLQRMETPGTNRRSGFGIETTTTMTISARNTCLFCDPPADRIFFRSELVNALWDGFPVSPGHALIVPRRHMANWFESNDDERMALFAALDAAKAIIDERQHPDGYNIGINSGAAAGQTIFHLHVHLIPRFAGDVADPRGGVRYVIPDRANYTKTHRDPDAPADSGSCK